MLRLSALRDRLSDFEGTTLREETTQALEDRGVAGEDLPDALSPFLRREFSEAALPCECRRVAIFDVRVRNGLPECLLGVLATKPRLEELLKLLAGHDDRQLGGDSGQLLRRRLVLLGGFGRVGSQRLRGLAVLALLPELVALGLHRRNDTSPEPMGDDRPQGFVQVLENPAQEVSSGLFGSGELPSRGLHVLSDVDDIRLPIQLRVGLVLQSDLDVHWPLVGGDLGVKPVTVSDGLETGREAHPGQRVGSREESPPPGMWTESGQTPSLQRSL